MTWIAQRFYRSRKTLRRQPLDLKRRVIAPEERSPAAHEVAVDGSSDHITLIIIGATLQAESKRATADQIPPGRGAVSALCTDYC